MDQLTYNTTYVKLYLKEIPYAAASIGISSFFLIAFLTYLLLFIAFIISVKIRNSSWCEKEEDDPMTLSHDKQTTQQNSGNPISNHSLGAGLSQSHRNSFSVHSVSNSPQQNGKSNNVEKKEPAMNRNQKVMFFMVICLVVIQILALSVRCVSDILSIMLEASFKQLSSVIVTDENLKHQIATFFVFASAELGLTFGNMTTTLVIMCFVLNVFLTTCQKIGAISPKSFKILQISIISGNVIYFLIASSIMLVISVGYLLARLAIVKDFLLAFYISIFMIDISMIIIETILFNVYGFKVVSTINQQAVKSQREQKRLCVKRKRFAKIIVLQLGLSFCAVLQVVAMILQTITRVSGSDIWETAHYFVNSFGILSFAIVVLMLYNPLFNYTEKQFQRKQKKRLDGQPSNTTSAIDTDSVYSGEPTSPMTPSFSVDHSKDNVNSIVPQFSQYLTVPGKSENLTNSTSSLISEECHTPTSIVSDSGLSETNPADATKTTDVELVEN